jgi:hypothetical protein
MRLRSTTRPLLTMRRRPRRMRAVAVLGLAALACALAPSALAAASYRVNLKLPSLVQNMRFKVTATGTSPRGATLAVFLSKKSCAASSKTEATRPGRKVIGKSVRGGYTASKTVSAGASGGYHACAYLTTGSTTRASASKGYTVLVGTY